MKNLYVEFKTNKEKEFNNFPRFIAISEKEFEKGKKKLKNMIKF